MKKERIDLLLVKREFFPTQEQAKAAILSGCVFVKDRVVDKAGTLVEIDIPIVVKQISPYVSRGGLKLEKALLEFQVDVKDKVALDVGASTGGFTDCLLKAGTKQVIAVDVGYGQLDWSLRQDKRVFLLERTNIRYLTPDKISALAQIVTIDVSFISVKKIIDNLKKLITKDAQVIVLIKPQFEVGKEFVKKGVVGEASLHKTVILDLWKTFEDKGFSVCGLTFSPILGPKGNIEFFMYLKQNGEKLSNSCIMKKVEFVVSEAHRKFGELKEEL